MRIFQIVEETLAPDARVSIERLHGDRYRWRLSIYFPGHTWIPVTEGIERSRERALAAATESEKRV